MVKHTTGSHPKVDLWNPAPLRMPHMLVLYQYQDFLGHPKGAGLFPSTGAKEEPCMVFCFCFWWSPTTKVSLNMTSKQVTHFLFWWVLRSPYKFGAQKQKVWLAPCFSPNGQKSTFQKNSPTRIQACGRWGSSYEVGLQRNQAPFHRGWPQGHEGTGSVLFCKLGLSNQKIGNWSPQPM